MKAVDMDNRPWTVNSGQQTVVSFVKFQIAYFAKFQFSKTFQISQSENFAK
jgi:hypothetical protein